MVEQIAGHTGPGSYGIPGTDYGQLVVNGDVALNGSFEVQVIGGFVPIFGQKYLAIDNRGSKPIDGTFSDLQEGDIVWAGNYGFLVSYIEGDGNDFVLTMDRFANSPHQADAGGPYEVFEGGLLTLSAAASSDAQQTTTTLIFAWDLDGDGLFGETGNAAGRGDENGMEPVFSAAGLDGPGEFTVSVRVTDEFGESSSDTALIRILNSAPTSPVDNDASPNDVPENSPAGTLVGISAFSIDPGVADTITYSLSVDAGGRFAMVRPRASSQWRTARCWTTKRRPVTPSRWKPAMAREAVPLNRSASTCSIRQPRSVALCLSTPTATDCSTAAARRPSIM